MLRYSKKPVCFASKFWLASRYRRGGLMRWSRPTLSFLFALVTHDTIRFC